MDSHLAMLINLSEISLYCRGLRFPGQHGCKALRKHVQTLLEQQLYSSKRNRVANNQTNASQHFYANAAGPPRGCIHAASRVGTLKPALLAALLRAPAVVAQRLVGLRLELPACDVKELVLRDPAVLLRVRGTLLVWLPAYHSIQTVLLTSHSAAMQCLIVGVTHAAMDEARQAGV